MTYWALGSREMVGVEFLHNFDRIPDERLLSVRRRSRFATAMADRDARSCCIDAAAS